MDYSESMIEAKRLLKHAEDCAMKRDYQGAFEAIRSMDLELHKMLNWFWKEMDETP